MEYENMGNYSGDYNGYEENGDEDEDCLDDILLSLLGGE